MARQIALCTRSFPNEPIETVLASTRKLGLDQVELWQVSHYYKGRGHVSTEQSPQELRALRDLAAQNGVKFAHLAGYAGLQFSHDDEAERQKDIDWARRTIDMCAVVGVPIVRVGTGRSNDPALTQRIADCIAPLARQAAAGGMKLSFETHNKCLADHPDKVLGLLKQIGEPNVGVCFDPANYEHIGVDHRAATDALASHVVAVHVKNVRRERDATGAEKLVASSDSIREGLVDWPAVVRRLDTAGFAGPWILEYEGPQAEHDTIAANLANWAGYLRSLA